MLGMGNLCFLKRDVSAGMASLKQRVSYHAAHLAMAGYIRARDPSRPVHYEGGGARTAATDILCPMYARIGQARSAARPLCRSLTRHSFSCPHTSTAPAPCELQAC